MTGLAVDFTPAAIFVGTLAVLLACIGAATVFVAAWTLWLARREERRQTAEERRWAEVRRVLAGHTESDR